MERELILCSIFFLIGSVISGTCTGGQVRCPDSMTCCQLGSDEFGCCPFPDAKCCADRVHCCPHNMECDVSHQSCLRNGSPVSFYWQVPIHPEIVEPVVKERPPQNEVDDLQQFQDPGGKCPDGHPCPEKYTCCEITGKRYGCCPYTDARCCDDGIHCCPKGTNCNITLGTCDIQKTIRWSVPSQSLVSLQWTGEPKEVVSDHIEEVEQGYVICPDGISLCPSGSTCCLLRSGVYGCCPMERATCCRDKKHCCPFGYKCFLFFCLKGSHYLPLFRQTTATVRTPQETKVESKEVKEVAVVICPDWDICPSHNTCCKAKSGRYECCPLEKATCCPDKVHCCPHGFRCFYGRCSRTSGLSWILSNFLTAIAITRGSETYEVELDEDQEVLKGDLDEDQEVLKGDLGIMCPDKHSQCLDGATCCQLASGDYGCCLFENATCCGDQEHCCPHGYWCTDDGCDRIPGTLHHKLSSAKQLVGSRQNISPEMLLP